MKRVRIVNDGKASFQTKITDVETGEELQCVRRAEITLDVNEYPRAVLEIVTPVVDVIVDAVEKRVCPCCGRPIEEADGSETPKQ